MIKIAIIDDNESITDMLNETLKLEEDMEVVVVSNVPTNGVKKMVNNPPDVLVLDIDMPHINGFLVSARIHAAGLTPVIIFMSGHHDWANMAMSLGDAFIKKPFNTKILIEKIRELTDN